MTITSVPNLHVSTQSKVKGDGEVFLQNRVDGTSAGTFTIRLNVTFNTGGTDLYPSGPLVIITKLSDGIDGTFSATSIETINSFGKHTPTVALTGRCDVAPSEHVPAPKGCRFWVLIANNKRANPPPGHAQTPTPDIVSFVITDKDGNRVNYGTGPLRSGDILVETA